jgi:hypothetical protein
LHDIRYYYLFSSPADFQDVVKSSLPKLVEMTVTDDDEDVHNAGMQSLKVLVQDSALTMPLCCGSDRLFFLDQAREIIKLTLLPNLQPFEAYDWRVRARAIDTLVTLVKDSEPSIIS